MVLRNYTFALRSAEVFLSPLFRNNRMRMACGGMPVDARAFFEFILNIAVETFNYMHTVWHVLEFCR
jgi:hypothetical protein